MSCKLAITSISLGLYTAGHLLVDKLNALQAYGYLGIELFYDDLVGYASHIHNEPDIAALQPEMLIVAARHIGYLCRCRGLSIVSLQPFRHYEGLLDRHEHARRIEELKLWFQLAHELGTDLVCIPSTFLPPSQVSDDIDLHVADLQEAADLAAAVTPPLRLSFESLCWGTRSDTWEVSWEIVKKVDRANFGLCFDTFNLAGRIYADPALPGGKNPGNPEQAVAESLARLVAEVDVSRVFVVQVVDAERLAQPIVPGHVHYDAATPPRMAWGRNCRLFYGETDAGAYLPVQQICWAIFQDLGYKGWVSFEFLNRCLADKGPHVVDSLAQRGRNSWSKFVRDMQVQGSPSLVDKSLMLSPSL